ncbi:tripartite ATP-independent transporter DctP family solute receptor [Neisseria perflava]|uniref:TRAP transporter substrate-binding protein n=1 Tax=Neisseria perflava TaxID=33053 RepID=UPI00209F3CA5|nr:TRAP transporter substrate-binding protein [Neisseria perflava]MCP1772728.1 tripartite ATP-independent transporter DctP family solute receptor [Neisseria perflava]
MRNPIPRFTRLLAAAALCTAAIGAQAQEVLKLGHVTPPTHVWHKVALKIGENLKSKSGGEMTVAVSPLSKLGSEGLMMDMLRSGALPMAILTVGPVSNREPAFMGWSLPYLFRDVHHATAAASTPVTQDMLKSLDKHGMVGMGYGFAGMRHVLSSRTISSPADLKNQKVRVFPNPVYKDYWQALGTAPTPLPLSEVAPGLTTNLLDAVDIDLDALVGMKFHQQAPNLALTNHMAFPSVIVVSKRYWDGLNDKQRKMLADSIKEAEIWGYTQAVTAEESNLQTVVKDGAKLQKVDLKPFTAIGEKVSQSYTVRYPKIQQFYQQAKTAK